MVITSPVADERGVVIGGVGGGRDIAEDLGTQQALLDSRDALRLALAAGRLGTWKWDMATGTVRFDKQLETIFGLPPGGFDGRLEDYQSLLHPDDGAHVLEVVHAAVAAKSDYDVEHRCVWPDGSLHWLGRGSVTLDADGRTPITTGEHTMTLTLVARRRPQGPQTSGMGREELQGRAAGVIVGAVFGLTWAASALPRLDSVVAVPVLAASVATFAMLMTGAHRLRRAATTVPASPPPAGLGTVARRFAVVVAIEMAAIVAAANLLARSGHSQWIPAVICALVGLHFIPLARLFGVALYYASALALCLAAGATMILGSSGAPTSLWQLLPGFGAALVLWSTSAGLLATTT